MSNLTDLDIGSVTFVTLNLRYSDKEEVFGLMPHASPVLLALQIMEALGNAGRGRVVWHQGKPAAIVGFSEYRPGVWQAVLLGTEDFGRIAGTCLRWLTTTIADLIENHGARRIQCESHENHHDAHRFLRSLGASPEGVPMLRYGKDGCAYQRFVWFSGDWSKMLRERAA